MRTLSNELLIESYVKAVHMRLDIEFVDLLLMEIRRRRLNVPYPHADARAYDR